jgi:hypothetical protein
MDRAERRRRTTMKLLERVRVLRVLDDRLNVVPTPVVSLRPDSRELLGYRGTLQCIGMCRSKHPFDCGNPRCGVCSPGRRYGRVPTRQEKHAALAEAEWLDDCDFKVV